MTTRNLRGVGGLGDVAIVAFEERFDVALGEAVRDLAAGLPIRKALVDRATRERVQRAGIDIGGPAEERRVLAEHPEPLDVVPKLADVALPLVRLQALHQLVIEPYVRAHLAREVSRERFDVLGSLAQRRHTNERNGEAMKEVQAEATVLDFALEVTVRGGHDADVDVDRAPPADPAKAPSFEHAEQPRLQRRRKLADLVEEHRAARRLFERARTRFVRARERALFVTEELRFDQRLRHRGEVDDHEGTVATLARAMDRLRQHLLAGPRFAFEQDGDIRGRGLLEAPVHRLKRAGRPDETAETIVPARRRRARFALRLFDDQLRSSERQCRAARKLGGVDAHALDEAAVLAAVVTDGDAVGERFEEAVPPRNGGVGQHDVAVLGGPERHRDVDRDGLRRVRTVDDPDLVVLGRRLRKEELGLGHPRILYTPRPMPKKRITLEVGGHEVGVSSPDKVYFPDAGYTKLDVVQYYVAVAEGALANAAGRPLVLKRYVDGIAGEGFYQKRAPKNRPAFVHTAVLSYPSGRTAEEVVLTNPASLVWIVNLGCIELHTHAVRAEDLHHPDELRIDLDPGPGVEWSQVREVAHVVHEVLADLGLVGWPKTSGSRGMHINARIRPEWPFDVVRAAAQGIAREVAKRAPNIATAAWWKEERHGVFLDYNQNAKDKTTAAAYSVRPVPDARVSMPLRWEEIDTTVPEAFTIATAPARFAEVGHVHAAMNDHVGGLEEALELAASFPNEKKPKRTKKMPLLEIGRAKQKADALAGLERWKARHPEAAAHLEPADVLVDKMRGRSSIWFRLRVNLIHVPEALRPPQEELDPNYDARSEWTR